MNNEAIVNSIKNLCKNENISASQLEKEIGLSQGLISKWIKTTPSLDKIIDIADYFHKSVDEVIGRKANFDDEFLKIIYSKTIDKSMTWFLNSAINKDRIKLPQRDNFYDDEMYTEISYVSKFNQGAFIINCFCEYHKTISPKDLDFYIKPDDKSELVWQDYDINQLKPLWIAIINNLIEGAPNEIKVENFKQQFISDKSNEILIEHDPDSKSFYKRIAEYYKEFNKPEFHEFYEKLTSPQYAEILAKFDELTKLPGEDEE